ncbi:MAG: tyrosine-type recombinase/integrase [Nitrospira sp.]
MTYARHTFASWLIMRGVPLATVSNLLGHTSPTMTLRYAHLSPQHLTTAIRLLDPQSSTSPYQEMLAINH